MNNLDRFIKMNNIDIDAISKCYRSKMYNLDSFNPIFSRYAIYNDPVYSRRSIADIIGISSLPDNYDRDNIVNNLEKYFSKTDNKTDSYNNRSNSMLEYTQDNVIEGLYSSFKKEPMVIVELENGGALISGNGIHRYHVLRIFYLNEFVKIKNSEELLNLNQKYTIPLKVETIDLMKTYCNFMFSLMGIRYRLVCERDKSYNQTGNSTITFPNGELVASDEMLINIIRANLNKLSNKTEIINECLTKIPSFRYYIESYFPELVYNNKKGLSK